VDHVSGWYSTVIGIKDIWGENEWISGNETPRKGDCLESGALEFCRHDNYDSAEHLWRYLHFETHYTVFPSCRMKERE
jgi:hypothetical protein